jgi:NADH:ubiquinone oxidoreductase subunit 6 (subunit J)
MTEKHFKLIQWLLYGLMAISALFGLLFYLNPGSSDLLIYWGYFLVIVSAVVTIALSILGMMRNPKGSVKVLVIIAAMILVGIISYAVSKNTLTPTELEKYGISSSGVKMVGAGLMMTYIICVVAIGVFLYTSLRRFLK